MQSKIYGWWGMGPFGKRQTKSAYTLVRLKRHSGKGEKGKFYIQVQRKNKRGKWVTFKKKFKSENNAVDFLCAVVRKMQIRQRHNGSLD